ncbi:hypothetical protein [Prosthecomicrobium pneumaticum]|uniref:Uncharacterized protein n=1 Tax=Prosthecomicrobium pneumaticum TaxID=81895 RepID=A0A7W9CUR7_9HYPH|nr:hypothetical protein [Prosthecomicrobium pneumaticum]MBB5751938.1 hypothetical protein [Prosthecomicrobium pneumaticum]
MTRPKDPTFRSKTERDREEELKARYRDLGNPELVAATRQLKAAKPLPRPQQMQAQQKSEREFD